MENCSLVLAEVAMTIIVVNASRFHANEGSESQWLNALVLIDNVHQVPQTQ